MKLLTATQSKNVSDSFRLTFFQDLQDLISAESVANKMHIAIDTAQVLRIGCNFNGDVRLVSAVSTSSPSDINEQLHA